VVVTVATVALAALPLTLALLARSLLSLSLLVLLTLSRPLPLLLAAVYALAIVVPPWAAALIVGVLVLAIAGALAFYGKSRLRADALTPERTLRSLREDQAWIKERFR